MLLGYNPQVKPLSCYLQNPDFISTASTITPQKTKNYGHPASSDVVVEIAPTPWIYCNNSSIAMMMSPHQSIWHYYQCYLQAHRPLIRKSNLPFNHRPTYRPASAVQRSANWHLATLFAAVGPIAGPSSTTMVFPK